MDGPRARWIAVGVVVVGVVLLAISDDAAGSQLPLGVAAGIAAALAAQTAAAYRGRRDPAMLLLAAGSAAYACNTALLPFLVTSVGGRGDLHEALRIVSVQTYGALSGAAVLAVCLAFVVPWRDRRGRPPLRVSTVASSVGVPLLLVDVLLLTAQPIPPAAFGTLFPSAVWGPVPVLVGLVTLVAGTVAAGRSIERGGWQAWIGAGAIALALVGTAALIQTGLKVGSDLLLPLAKLEVTLPVLATSLLLVGVVVTQRSETSRMRRATDRAAAVMEGRAEIASMVAHDVRGPVTTIKGLATTTKNSYGRLGDAERLEFIGMIETESGRLLDLVNQTALALKVDADTLAYDRRSQEVGPIVRMAVDAVDVGAHPLTVEIDPALTAAVDVKWLTEAIRQGLENAVKFSPGDAAIAVTATSTDDGAAIEIRDGGPGIPEERRGEVFERFSTWRPSGYEDRPGSALGLFIVRGIARAHGGDASLADAPGGGTILRIAVPTKEATG